MLLLVRDPYICFSPHSQGHCLEEQFEVAAIHHKIAPLILEHLPCYMSISLVITCHNMLHEYSFWLNSHRNPYLEHLNFQTYFDVHPT